MQLTKYTDISVRVLMHLAAHPRELATIREIASLYGVSQNHLMKVVNRLSTLGYVTSVRGRGGGISLALAPEAISVGDIVRQMELTLDVVNCEKLKCPIVKGCLLKAALNHATRAFLSTLDDYTVADLVANPVQILALTEAARGS